MLGQRHRRGRVGLTRAAAPLRYPLVAVSRSRRRTGWKGCGNETGRRLAERLASDGEPVDLLINDAGTIVCAPAASIPTTRDDPHCARAILERIPAGRWGRPENVVGPVVFLAVPASDHVHGAVLAVGGGWLVR